MILKIGQQRMEFWRKTSENHLISLFYFFYLFTLFESSWKVKHNCRALMKAGGSQAFSVYINYLIWSPCLVSVACGRLHYRSNAVWISLVDARKCPWILNLLSLSTSDDTRPVASGSSSSRSASRRKRTSFSKEHVELLRATFETDPYPGISLRESLSQATGLPESRIQVCVPFKCFLRNA